MSFYPPAKMPQREYTVIFILYHTILFLSIGFLSNIAQKKYEFVIDKQHDILYNKYNKLHYIDYILLFA